MTTESKLETVDGYTIIDIDGAARLVGPIRSAKKVLQRTTIDLVRHATYACAVHGLDAAGAAAALNHDRSGEDHSPIATFADELAAWAEVNTFVGAMSLGLSADEVGATLSPAATAAEDTVAASAAECVPDGADNVVIASDIEESALALALGNLNVTVESDLGAALTSGADVVFVRGKTGVLNHQVLEDTNAKTIIGLQPLTTTARGLAVAGRAGAIVVPDFISAAGPVLAALGHSADEIVELTKTLLGNLTGHGVDLFVAASEHAETHMRTMTNSLPFGRPLAP